MTDSQWRILFRSIFPQANDSAFIDRLYAAIVKKKQHPQITFEVRFIKSISPVNLSFQDLILCLWELSEDGKTSEMGNYHINSSARAQFAFQLMDEEGKVRENNCLIRFSYLKILGTSR